MVLGNFGLIAQDEWLKTAILRLNVKAGQFIIMPNHVHGIITITAPDAARCVPTEAGRLIPGSLPAIIQGYKSGVTKRINEMRGSPGEPVWQERYWDHVVRDELELGRIVEYIDANPVNWAKDEENILDSEKL